MAFGTLDRTPPPFFRQGPSALTKLIFFSALAVFLMVADSRFQVATPVRATLAVLPRGGGNGDEIRMFILNVMRENGIREGHRPGIEDRFLEEWHQASGPDPDPDPDHQIHDPHRLTLPPLPPPLPPAPRLQKLHSNTTPDDIAICEAYLHFLHTGDWGEFFKAMWDNHAISAERLAAMSHPIRGPGASSFLLRSP